ncbi:MAG: hypothetical protein ACTJLK_04040 [Anaplasma sp.]
MLPIDATVSSLYGKARGYGKHFHELILKPISAQEAGEWFTRESLEPLHGKFTRGRGGDDRFATFCVF